MGLVAVGIDLAFAAAEVIFTKEGGGGVVRAAILVAAAILVYVGINWLDQRPWPGVIVTSIGALVGGVSLIWILIPVPLAFAIVAMSVTRARVLTESGATLET